VTRPPTRYVGGATFAGITLPPGGGRCAVGPTDEQLDELTRAVIPLMEYFALLARRDDDDESRWVERQRQWDERLAHRRNT